MNLFGISQFGKSSNVTAQNRLNCYLEPQSGDDRTVVAVYGTPGLVLFASFGETPIRGLHVKNTSCYVVHRGFLYELDNAGTKTIRGAIGTSSGRVNLSDNGVQLILTDGVAGYVYFFDDIAPVSISTITFVGTLATLTTATPHGLSSGRQVTVTGASPTQYNGSYVITVLNATQFLYNMATAPATNATSVGSYTVPRFTQITDPNYPNLSTVTWMDSYFIGNKPNTQQFYISSSYDGLSWDALDFASAEANPDNIVAVIADNSTLYLFGSISTEFWNNNGAQDFPYARISGGSSEIGLAAVNSLVKYDNTLAFLGKNRMGQVFVARYNGYSPEKLSTAEIDYIINKYPTVEDATAFAYNLGGHAMLQINFPTADETWLYDGYSKVWSKLQSYKIGRHRAEIGVNFLNKILVSDFSNGNLYRLDSEAYSDNGDPIAFEIVTKHITSDDKRLKVDMLQLVMESGVGAVTGQGDNPQVMLSVSKDGGHTFGTEQWASFGAIGEYKARAIWRRLGIARDWAFKFRITDPVKRVLVSANINTSQGSS